MGVELCEISPKNDPKQPQTINTEFGCHFFLEDLVKQLESKLGGDLQRLYPAGNDKACTPMVWIVLVWM